MMRRRTALLVVLLVCLGALALGGCGSDDTKSTSATAEKSTQAETDSDSGGSGDPVAIAGPEDLAGTWTGTWNNMYSVGGSEPEAWAEGSIEFSAEGTYRSQFTPVTDEAPVDISEEFAIGEAFGLTTVTIHGRPYFAEINGDTLTLTGYSDDGSPDGSPTFVLTR